MLLRASSLWSGSSNAAPIGGGLRARSMRALFLKRGPARPGSEGRPGALHGLCDYARYRFPLERRPVDLQHQHQTTECWKYLLLPNQAERWNVYRLPARPEIANLLSRVCGRYGLICFANFVPPSCTPTNAAQMTTLAVMSSIHSAAKLQPAFAWTQSFAAFDRRQPRCHGKRERLRVFHEHGSKHANA